MEWRVMMYLLSAEYPLHLLIADVQVGGVVGNGLTGCKKTLCLRRNFTGQSVWKNGRILPHGAQKGRSARPQRAKRRGVRFGTLSLWAMRERCWRAFSASC